MTITRRGLLAGILAAGVAPAFAAPTRLMKLWTPKRDRYHLGSRHTEAALLDAQGNELVGNGYGRAPYVPGQDIVFPAATGSWGAITHVFVNGRPFPLTRQASIFAGDSVSVKLHLEEFHA